MIILILHPMEKADACLNYDLIMAGHICLLYMWEFASVSVIKNKNVLEFMLLRWYNIRTNLGSNQQRW